jgi:SAM-dependent methyltransferase
MQAPPPLTDRATLLRHRARAARAPALFLQELAADELQERLIEVNRTFTAPAVVTGMPDLWRSRLPQARIVADDEVLALDEGAHDLVIHAMCLHWANDPVGQLVQCRRALRPDGLFLGVLFGGRTLAELRASLAEAEAAVTGGLSPRVLPMGEIRDLGGLFCAAGGGRINLVGQLRGCLRPDGRSAGDGRDERASGAAAPPHAARGVRRSVTALW